MKCETEGKILVELPATSGISKNGKEWEKREFVIETNEKYHSKMRFAMYSFDGPIENPPRIGDTVKVAFTVEAREYKNNWYNEVKAHRIELVNR